MPSLKPLNRYPPEFKELLVDACRRGATTIPHSSAFSAEATRRDLYNYRTMLKAEGQAGDPEAARLAILFDALVFHIDGSLLFIEDIEGETFYGEIKDES